MNGATSGWVRSHLLESRFYYGWYVVFTCFMLSTMTSGTMFSFGVFLDSILDTYGRTYANTSLVFGVQSFITYGGAALLGFVIDRYGVRRLLAIAAGLLTLGLGGASQAASFWVLVFSYSVVAAVGLGIVFVIAYTTPPRWFDKRRGLATGIAVSGTGVGIITVPPVSEGLIRMVGWQEAYIGLGALFLATIAFAGLIIAKQPADLNVDVTGEMEVLEDEMANSGEVRSVRKQVADVLDTARSRLFGLVMVGLLFAFIPPFAVLVFLVEFTESVGVAREVGVLGVSIVGGMNVVAKFLAGGVADYVGMDRTMSLCTVLMGVTLVGLVTVNTPLAILVLAALFGLGYGGIAALMSPLIANLFGTTDLSALFGLSAIGFAVGGVSVPYLIGFGFDILGNYGLPFLATAACGFVAAGAFASVHALRRANAAPV